MVGAQLGRPVEKRPGEPKQGRLCLLPGGAPAGTDPPDSGDDGILHRAQHLWSERPLPTGGLSFTCCVPRTEKASQEDHGQWSLPILAQSMS